MILCDSMLSHMLHFPYILVITMISLLINRYKMHHNPAEPWPEMELPEFILRMHFVSSSFSMILQCCFLFKRFIHFLCVRFFTEMRVCALDHLCFRCMKKPEDCVRLLGTEVNGGCKTT